MSHSFLSLTYSNTLRMATTGFEVPHDGAAHMSKDSSTSMNALATRDRGWSWTLKTFTGA